MQRGVTKRIARIALPAFALALTTGCDRRGGEAPEPEASPTGSQRSIFQPEFQVESTPEPDVMTALETVIGFPDGTELTEQARAELATVIESPQVEAGNPITLRGHSDSGGSDEANMRASRARAEAVRDWMVENGIAEDRITVIAFGEQNPVEPNALPDGSPNEEGRAENRRVEIFVRGERRRSNADAPAEPTLIETLSSPEPGESQAED